MPPWSRRIQEDFKGGIALFPNSGGQQAPSGVTRVGQRATAAEPPAVRSCQLLAKIERVLDERGQQRQIAIVPGRVPG